MSAYMPASIHAAVRDVVVLVGACYFGDSRLFACCAGETAMGR